MIVPQINGLPTSGLAGYSATSASIENAKSGIFSNTTAMLGSTPAPTAATLPDQKIESARSNKLVKDLSPLSFPSDLSTEYYISFNAFYHSQERPQESKRTFTFNKSVYLPLPTNISDSYSSSYNADNLYVLGNAAKNGLTQLMAGEGGTLSVTNILQNVPETGGKSVAKAVEALTNDTKGTAKKVAAAGLTYLAEGIGGPLMSAAKSAFQVTTNPFPVMVFQGAGLKPPFSFGWTLYPESLDEAMAIKKIIGYFRREMLPETMEGIQSILKTPAVFEIKMVPDENTRKFKRCVLTDMVVDYAPNGPAFIKENAADPSQAAVPAAITLSLTFREIEVWLADDFSTDESNYFEPINRIPPPVPSALPGVQGTVANNATRGVAAGTPFGM